MSKIKVAITISFLLLGGAAFFALQGADDELDNARSPASIPANYDALSACDKQKSLWENIQATTYTGELPDYRKFGLMQLIGMSRQKVATKGSLPADFAPEGWKKYLHRRAAIAQVRLVPRSQKYTGVFQGAECALLRLSLTYKTAGKRPVAPGLALKVLRDGSDSANISALVSLDGQGKDFNFFKNPMSNIVPIGGGFGQKMVHRIFRKASHYPEELLAQDMALIDARGVKAQEAISPRQIFFVPGPGVAFPSEEHDVRQDFLKIPAGTVVYQVHALSEKHADFDYKEYTPALAATFLTESEHIADLVTTSPFVASSFGDDGIFFRHELRP